MNYARAFLKVAAYKGKVEYIDIDKTILYFKAEKYHSPRAVRYKDDLYGTLSGKDLLRNMRT